MRKIDRLRALLERNGPQHMPPRYFPGVLRLDHNSAVRADVGKQNYVAVPRHWYVDATLNCGRCGRDFRFTVAEQRAWYEDYRFSVDAFPKLCKGCRGEIGEQKAIRAEYDRDIAAALAGDDRELKARVLAAIDRLREAGVELPAKMLENRRLLAKRIEK